MNPSDAVRLAAFFGVFLFVVASSVRGGELKSNQDHELPERILVGQVVLPRGEGSRGVEVRIMAETIGDESRSWVLFDVNGHFSHPLQENPSSLIVTVGGAEVHRIDAVDFPEIDPSKQIDVGVIDLRDRLTEHRLMLRAADGAPPGEVRVALWMSPPPVGPYGEPVSLGSRQFPPVALGSEMAWLLPHKAQSIYFLVERPVGPSRGRAWVSGRQRLFGPYTMAELPTELVMD